MYIGDVETCWVGGGTESVFANEMLDFATQSGGRYADKQDFIDVRYKTGTWNLLTRALGHACDVIYYPDPPDWQNCITSTSDSNNYYAWDSRF